MDGQTIRCLLADEECVLFFAYMRTYLRCLLAGKVPLFPDDVSDTYSKFRLIVYLLARI